MFCTKYRLGRIKPHFSMDWVFTTDSLGSLILQSVTMYFHLLSFSYMITLEEFLPYVI